MRINFNQVLKTIEGEPLEDIDRKKGSDGYDTGGKPITKKLTLKDVSRNSLTANYEDERNLSADEKLSRYDLATKIYNNGAKEGKEIPVSAEEITMLKKLIGKAYGVLVVGAAFKILDPK